jgi:pSer/pThr/pTyr-binding forkhead associated (FHA) protein
VDLESANGVYLNGVRVHSAGLFEGDTIQIGDVLLMFREGR